MSGNIIRRSGWVGFLAIPVIMLAFALSQGAGAQSPEGTSVPAGEGAPQAETYIGPEGEVLYTGSGALEGEQAITETTAVTTTVGAYVNISASNIPPREAGTTRAYGGAGCAYRTSASGFFTTDLQLPMGAKIVTIRAQYYDASAADGKVYLYSYDGSGNFQQLGVATTSGAGGYGTSFSPEINHTVDNENESLALVLDYATASDSSLRFCNIRVTYNREVNLPVVVK